MFLVTDTETKDYLTVPEQIEHLQQQGLICAGGMSNIYLNSIGSYKLINAYRRPFLKIINGERRYIENTRIHDIHELYMFDKHLRELLLSYLNIIEIDIKAKITTLISEKYGVKESDWLKVENFRPDLPNSKKKSFIDLQNHIIGNIAKQKIQHPAIRHFADTYNYYPFWAVSSILTFGCISQIYSKLTREDQTHISRQYSILPETLESILISSVLFRNASAHNDVIYSYKANDIVAKGIKKIYELLKIPKNKFGKYQNGINDLFALIITFKIMLPKTDLRRFFAQFNSMLSIIKRKLPEEIYKIIFKTMNLPENYNDIKYLKY
jgi:abortive infection bacteriophage resistance protein